MKHFYIIYRIVNKVNNKFYIGIHKTKNINDNYFGSGNLIKSAIKKYGLDNFEKKILHIFVNKRDAFDKEKELVTEDLVKDENCYNIKLGGNGGFDHIRDKNLHKSVQGKKIIHFELTKQTIRVEKKQLTKFLKNGWKLGFLPESLEKMSKAGKNKIQTNEHRKKNSETKKNSYIMENLKTKKRKFIKKELAQEYINNGWVIYKKTSLKGYKAIHDPLTKKEIKVPLNSLNSFLENGWKLGFSPDHLKNKCKKQKTF